MPSIIDRVIERLDEATPTSLKRGLKSLVPGIDRWMWHARRRVTSDALVEVEIRGGPLAGRRIPCSLRNERHYWVGIHEQRLVRELIGSIRQGDVVYDLGAHRGYLTMVAAQCVGPEGTVIAFEANPANADLVDRTLAINPD